MKFNNSYKKAATEILR